MKVYSRGQVVGFSLVSALIVALFAFGIGLVKLPFFTPAAVPSADETAVAAEKSGFALKESAATTPVVMTQKTASLQSYSNDEKENISVYDTLNDAVVNITTEKVMIDWFLQPVPQEGTTGSGSIIDTRGYVLTNNHVVSDAYKVYINFADGSQREGTVVGTDADNDLAVLKFEPPAGLDVKTVPFGDSENLKVGQKVLAIGNPFGMDRTLTVGIVSGLGRPIQTSRNHVIRDMIQTDASINPGNSGGPLLDSTGRMIGITTMIYSPSGASAGVGFAVPVNTAKRVVAELIQYGKVKRGWIDASVFQINSALVSYAKLPVKTGLLVSRTQKGGFAEKAGLKQGDEPVRYGSSVIYLGGDIITNVDGFPTETLADLFSALEDNKPGDKVAVEVNRAGKTVKLTITLADREELIRQ